MPKQSLPAGVVVIAILHFVGAGLSLCCAEIPALGAQAFGGVGASAKFLKAMGPAGDKAAADVEKLEQMQKQELPSYSLWVYASLSLNMIVSLMLIVSGIGLLMLQNWGRLLSLVYVPCSIVMRLCGVSYLLLIYNPVVMRFYDSQPLPPEMITSQKVSLYIGSLIGLVFLVYPVVVLFVLTRPSVVAAFKGERPADSYD